MIDLPTMEGLVVKNFMTVYEEQFKKAGKILKHQIEFTPKEFKKNNYFESIKIIKKCDRKTTFTSILSLKCYI